MEVSYKGRVVLVTGAGVGIGYGLCQAFARAGAYVALNDIDPNLAAESAAKINQQVGAERVTACGQDIADVAAVRQMVRETAARFGRLDVLIANAGITNFGPFLDYTPDAFDRVTGVNLRGTYFTAQAAALEMIARKTNNGRILLMASVTGLQAYPNLSTYGITKAAIIHLARVLGLELGQYGITVNAICPGATLTERTQLDDPNYESNWASVNPTGRVGYVEDIVAAALFLASPQARQITGQNIVVDGGWSISSPIPEESPDLPEESSKLR